jgi:hypothetical protein
MSLSNTGVKLRSSIMLMLRQLQLLVRQPRRLPHAASALPSNARPSPTTFAMITRRAMLSLRGRQGVCGLAVGDHHRLAEERGVSAQVVADNAPNQTLCLAEERGIHNLRPHGPRVLVCRSGSSHECATRDKPRGRVPLEADSRIQATPGRTASVEQRLPGRVRRSTSPRSAEHWG